jgi:hypothetical protein
LLGSSKYGKPASAALRISASYTFPFPEGFTNGSFYVPDMEKRVQQGHDALWDGGELDMEAEIKKFQAAIDWNKHATALADTLVVPMNSSKLDLVILDESDEAKALIVDSPAAKSDDVLTNTTIRGGGTSIISPSMRHGCTSFPAVDNFIENEVGCRGGVQGSIRAWSVENDSNGAPQSITYQMSRNRYCERLGRPHKSNNIMWTVDLRTMQCIQSCHDPECRSLRYRGRPVDLPKAVCESVADALFEQQLATLDEKKLLEKHAASVKENFDDAEFERALLALNINGDNVNDSKKVATGTVAETTLDELHPLSDKALLAAMTSNPNLFP